MIYLLLRRLLRRLIFGSFLSKYEVHLQEDEEDEEDVFSDKPFYADSSPHSPVDQWIFNTTVEALKATVREHGGYSLPFLIYKPAGDDATVWNYLSPTFDLKKGEVASEKLAVQAAEAKLKTAAEKQISFPLLACIFSFGCLNHKGQEREVILVRSFVHGRRFGETYYLPYKVDHAERIIHLYGYPVLVGKEKNPYQSPPGWFN